MDIQVYISFQHLLVRRFAGLSAVTSWPALSCEPTFPSFLGVNPLAGFIHFSWFWDARVVICCIGEWWDDKLAHFFFGGKRSFLDLVTNQSGFHGMPARGFVGRCSCIFLYGGGRLPSVTDTPVNQQRAEQKIIWPYIMFNRKLNLQQVPIASMYGIFTDANLPLKTIM